MAFEDYSPESHVEHFKVSVTVGAKLSSEKSVEFAKSPPRVSFPETWLWSDVVAGYGSL